MQTFQIPYNSPQKLPIEMKPREPENIANSDHKPEMQPEEAEARGNNDSSVPIDLSTNIGPPYIAFDSDSDSDPNLDFKFPRRAQHQHKVPSNHSPKNTDWNHALLR